MYKYENLVTVLDANSPQHKSWFLNENNEYELIDKKFSKYFRQSLVLELYWENSIDFKKIEKSFTNDEKISFLSNPLARQSSLIV